MSETLPRIVGRYALHDRFAAGGMATIHVGRLLGSAGFSRTVAIKRLREKHAGDPQVVAMLVDEARLAGRIHHPHVVQTLDVVYADGELFLVLEYVHGDSLAHLLRATQEAHETTEWRVAVAIVIDVLHGLHAAHEAKSEKGELLGLVHRDISPQNVLVGEDGVGRVADFGIAKAAQRLAQTNRGVVKGKLGYMAPEQLRGRATRLSDVFSVGVVLWETLTTSRLFDGQSELEIASRVERMPIVPPSRLVTGLPSAIDDAVLRALSRSPEARFETARDMARALEVAAVAAPASEVGAWVSRKAGPTLAARARLIASIESADVRSSDRTLSELLGGPRATPSVPPTTRRLGAPAEVTIREADAREHGATLREELGPGETPTVLQRRVGRPDGLPDVTLRSDPSPQGAPTIGRGILAAEPEPFATATPPGASLDLAPRIVAKRPRTFAIGALVGGLTIVALGWMIAHLRADSAPSQSDLTTMTTATPPSPPTVTPTAPAAAGHGAPASLTPLPIEPDEDASDGATTDPGAPGGSVDPSPNAAPSSGPAVTRPKPSRHCNPPYVTDSQGHMHFKRECL